MPTKKVSTSNSEILNKLVELDKNVSTLRDALIGTADNNAPGLMERVRKLEEWVANEKRLIYLIVGIIITDIITRLWSLIVK